MTMRMTKPMGLAMAIAKPKNIVWALFLAAVFLGAGALVFRYSGGYGRFFALASRLSWPQWAVLGAATALFYLLDYVRFYALTSMFGVRLSLAAGLRLTCVSYFVSSLTPTCDLHLPAMIYLLMRAGVPAAQAAAVSIAKSIYMVLWICAFAFATLRFRPDLRLPAAISGHLLLYSLPLLLLVLAFLFLIAFPGPVERWGASAPAGTPRWRARFRSGCGQCARALSLIGKSWSPMHLLCHAASILFVWVYVFMGWYLCRSYGIPVGWGKAAAAFSNSLMVAYLSPVPGSVGITEFATSYMLDPALTETGMVVSALLRFLCWYMVMLPGALLLADLFRREGLGRWRAAVAGKAAAA
jgi:uncharacterized membrane protein YbhN (UPF0104 family)